MINRYRRKAREVSELSLSDLVPLDEALGTLIAQAGKARRDSNPGPVD